MNQNKPLLSILICSLSARKHLLDRMLHSITSQFTPENEQKVEIIIDTDNGEVSIGEKRNRLLDKAQGQYLCFWDDDDVINPTALSSILNALQSQPDAVGFKQTLFWNADRLNTPHTRYCTNTVSTVPYCRVSGLLHLNPIKAEIAKSERFSDSNHGEDTEWVNKLYPKIKNELFLDEFVYVYLYIPQDYRITDDDSNAKRRQLLLKEIGILNPDGSVK